MYMSWNYTKSNRKMNADVEKWSIFSSILSSTSVEHAAPRRLKMAVLRICERVLLPTFSSEVPLKKGKFDDIFVSLSVTNVKPEVFKVISLE